MGEKQTTWKTRIRSGDIPEPFPAMSKLDEIIQSYMSRPKPEFKIKKLRRPTGQSQLAQEFIERNN